MPQQNNIEAPINIHGIGRSGTTLLQNVLGQSPDIQTCNETAGLIYCTWRAGESALLSSDTDAPVAPGGLPCRLVHMALLAAMPSRKRRWTQKLGGLPNQVVWDSITADDLDYASTPFRFPYTWYWRVQRTAFPASRDVLIIRDYRDVVVSRALFSQWNAPATAAAVAVYFNILSHPAAKIDHCVKFDDLVGDPPEATVALFRAVGADLPESPLRAFDTYTVSSGERTLERGRKDSFSWHERYDDFITPEIEQLMKPALSRLEARFGRVQR